jgi:hypothetical protein
VTVDTTIGEERHTLSRAELTVPSTKAEARAEALAFVTGSEIKTVPLWTSHARL